MNEQSWRRVQGFSLIELMVAMTLGLLLTFATISFFQDSLQSSRTTISTSSLQDVAQTALQTIKKDVRMSGFRGECVPLDLDPVPHSAISELHTVIALEGSGTQSDLLRSYTADIQSDPLYLWRFEHSTREMQICANPFAEGTSCTAAEYATDDLLLLSDCQQWAVFNPDRASSPGTPNPYIKPQQPVDIRDFLLPGSRSAEQGPDLRPLDEGKVVLYKLGTSATSGATEYQIIEDDNEAHRLRSGDKPSILFRNNEPLVYGVENLQVLFGRQEGGRIHYQPGCNDIRNERACADQLKGTTHLQISLVLQSDQRTGQAKAQHLPIANPSPHDHYQTAADGRLRRVYTSTIQLRNAP